MAIHREPSNWKPAGPAWDTRTLAGTEVAFTDGRKGIISGASQPYARVRSYDGQIDHEYAWPIVAYHYVNKGKAFPVA